MKKYLLILACLLSPAVGHADLTVDAGHWNLQPNQANQQIAISISGNGDVTNATVILEIAGPSPRPTITGGQIVNGTIFAANNTGFPAYDFSEPHLAYLDVATESGVINIAGSGTLATLDISTLGLTEGDYTLKLTQTQWGDTLVGSNPPVLVHYVDGSITIVPEPNGLGLLILAAPLLARVGRGWRRPLES